MRWHERWERRLRPWAIPNLTNLMVAFQAIVYVVILVNNRDPMPVIGQFGLIPQKVFAGEVWRVLTFALIPPAENPLFAFFYFYLFYLMGNALETRWGGVAFNLYMLIGLAGTAGLSLIGSAAYPMGFPADNPVSNQFVYYSIFLAFAYLFPDFTLMLFFILPIKIKWLAYLHWAMYALVFVGGIMSPGGWPVSAAIFASVANFFVFFSKDILNRMRASKRRMERTAAKLALANRPAHTCATCGITNLTNPDEEFRYCSKCEGSPAYCERHLREHEHI